MAECDIFKIIYIIIKSKRTLFEVGGVIFNQELLIKTTSCAIHITEKQLWNEDQEESNAWKLYQSL